jgi:hypothetical protein
MSSTTPWEAALNRSEPCDHLVQLYTDESFLAIAVGRFLTSGLTNGEAAVIIATPAHIAAFTDRLLTAGIDVEAAVQRAQLTVLDAEASLTAFMRDGMPDRDPFRALIVPVVDRARGAGYPRLRLFGEMVNLLWDHNLEATLQLEELWNEVVADQQVALLCAYRIDNFDRRAHRGVLHRISRCHSHLIPVDDYDRLDRAVDRAYADVFGPAGEAAALRELLLSRQAPGPEMPAAEAALLAIRQLSDRTADAVLDRARRYYHR